MRTKSRSRNVAVFYFVTCIMILRKSFTAFCIFFFLHSDAQQIRDTARRIYLDKELCLLTGIHYSNHTFIDLGIAASTFGTVGYHPISRTLYAGSEFHFVDHPMIAPKIGVWAAGGVAAMALGLNLLYQTDFDEGALIFRPEVGLGLDKFKLTYGYNVMLTNKRYEKIHENSFGLTYCFKLKKMKLNSPLR
jgi:hypothetical protein